MARILLLLVALLAFVHSANTQTSTDPNEGARLTYDLDYGLYTFSWWGRAGRTYFVQHSTDLITWDYLPDIRPGYGDPLGHEFYASGEKSFLRLQFSDIPTADPFNADFDGDKVNNWNEVNRQTDPLHFADTDDDDMSDDWETFYGLAPNDPSDAGRISLGGVLTNLEKYEQHLNPLSGDTDGDGISDVAEIQNGTDPRLSTVCTAFWVSGSSDEGIDNPTKADLHWTAPADPAVTGIRVEGRYDDQFSWQTLAQKSPGTNSHREENLLAKRYYQYRLIAVTVQSELPSSTAAYEVPVSPELLLRTVWSSINFPGFHDTTEARPTKYLTRIDGFHTDDRASTPLIHNGYAEHRLYPTARTDTFTRSWDGSSGNWSYSGSVDFRKEVPFIAPSTLIPSRFFGSMIKNNYQAGPTRSREWNQSASWKLTLDREVMQDVVGTITLSEDGESYGATLNNEGEWIGNLDSDHWDETWDSVFDTNWIDPARVTPDSNFAHTRSNRFDATHDNWAYRKHQDVFSTAEMINLAVSNLQLPAQTPEQWAGPFYENMGSFTYEGGGMLGDTWGTWRGALDPWTGLSYREVARWSLDDDELGFAVSRSQFKLKVNPSAVSHDIHLLHRFYPGSVGSGEPPEVRLIRVPIAAGAAESGVLIVDASDPAAFAARRNGVHHLDGGITVELNGDLNDDGTINETDIALKMVGEKSGASDQAKEDGTEYLFTNNQLSNGLPDFQDPKPPGHSRKDEDDLQLIYVTCANNFDAVWFEYEGGDINKLAFYRTKECKQTPDDRLPFPASVWDLSSGNLPEWIYVRAEGA